MRIGIVLPIVILLVLIPPLTFGPACRARPARRAGNLHPGHLVSRVLH